MAMAMNSNSKQSRTAPDAAAEQAIDLSQLAVQRSAPAPSAIKARRHWFTRYIIPLAILAGFASLFAWAARDSFLPAQSVTVTPVIVTHATVQQEGTPLFQAAGWIEPRPTPIVVSALAEGVVEEIYAVEGQQVEQGTPLAKLINTDAKLSLQQAEANLRLCEADVNHANAALIAARTTLENPNRLQAALADAESRLAETKLVLGNLPYMIETAKTRRQLAEENVDRKERAGQAIAGRVLREAKAELAAAESALAELQSRGPTLERQVEALERKRTALDEQLRLMTEQKRAVASAEATLAAAKARRDQAHLSVETARINLERMIVYAPISGRVLTLDARPGKRLMGMDPASEQNSSAVVTMYDPKSLQVRVDVRLEDVPNVQIGQPVEIETAALAKPIGGTVLWTTTRADIQKNTLQVKVTIDDPPAVITPEMLAQVTFLAPPQAVESSEDKQEPLRLMIPRQLVIGGEGGSSVWLADFEHRVARQQQVQIGRAATEQLVEVASGLSPTDKLIVMGRESLSEGARIRVTSEDSSIGVSTGRATGNVARAEDSVREPTISE
jgi:multidrug efflux pump subunit AcrA (membrane-fusion protein)